MDHTFPSTLTTGAKRHNLHQHQQQNLRNSLSPSPAAALNNYYRISPSPTNIGGTTPAILTAAALNSPAGGVSSLQYKSSPAQNLSSCYQTASQGQAAGNVAISNLYRLQMLTAQQQQQQQQQQQLQQFIQQQQLQPQVQIHSQSQAPGSSEVQYGHSHNQSRIVSSHNHSQYPVRIQQPQSHSQHSGNILQQQQPPLTRSPQQIQSSHSISQYSTSPNNSTPLSEINFRNLQQQQHSHHQHQSSSDSLNHLQYQHQRHSHSQAQHQSHNQYQNLIAPRTVSNLHQSQTTQQSQKMPNNSQSQQQQNQNSKNRMINSYQQQPQATITNNNNGLSQSNSIPTSVAQQQSQMNSGNGNSSNTTTTTQSAIINNNGNTGATNTSGNVSSPTQPQYRIFKRGDSIPGISSPIQINAQVNTNESGPGTTCESPENWDEPNAGGGKINAGETANTLDEQTGDKENTNLNTNLNSQSSPKSPSDRNKNTDGVKTPLSQIGEIARFHSVQVEYRLVKETGPPHAPTFTVLLHLGNEEFTGEGPSIKKAQHAAAVEALEKTTLTKPPPRAKPKNKFSSGGGTAGNRRPNWALIQLTNLAQEMQLPIQFVQQPVAIVDPFRRGEPPSVVSVHVGERIFTGEGSNFNAAKNMAVMIALKAMMKVKQEIDLAKIVQAGVDAEQSMMDADNKSPISIVHEMAMKRSLSVAFEIVQESGPPHMKVFTVKCKVGDELETEGQGPTKQAAKKSSSELMIAKLKEIPIQLPNSSQGLNLKAMQRGLLRQKIAKKKTSTPVLKDLEKQAVSPISRLIQICHIKKFKEPEFVLISTGTETNVENFLKQITERDRRMLRKKKPVFTIEVNVGSHACRGTGPNKKAAKKAAAEAAILALGYGPTEGAAEEAAAEEEAAGAQESSGKGEKSGGNAKSSGGGKKNTGKGGGSGKDSDGKSVKLTGARQIAPGIIVLKPETSGTGGTTSSAAAQEMKKVNNLMTSPATSSGTQSSREGIDKLAYLSKLLDISVSYSDFPKKNEYLSVVSLTTNPPHVAHGCGATLEEAQNAAALKILEELSTMDLDSVTAAAEKPTE